jgi:hypothetical protein
VTEAFRLSSRPGAKFKIVLDFDGNVCQGTQWNKVKGIDKITTKAYDKDNNSSTFSAEEIAGEGLAAVLDPHYVAQGAQSGAALCACH